jgi:CBS domain-containing protein
MPCHAAITEKIVTATPNETVKTVLKRMRTKKTDIIPVVEDNGDLAGYFSSAQLLKNLLPIPVSMADGIQLDIKIPAAPGIAKRLHKVQNLPVSDFMKRRTHSVYPDTPIWEGVRLLMEHQEPVFVLEAGTQKLLGLMTESSAIAELERLQE